MSREQQLQLLLEYGDLIKLGLAGNLRSFVLEDAQGNCKKGLQLPYGVQPAAYAAEPWETVNYAGCHDGEVLFDQVLSPAWHARRAVWVSGGIYRPAKSVHCIYSNRDNFMAASAQIADGA